MTFIPHIHIIDPIKKHPKRVFFCALLPVMAKKWGIPRAKIRLDGNRHILIIRREIISKFLTHIVNDAHTLDKIIDFFCSKVIIYYANVSLNKIRFRRLFLGTYDLNRKKNVSFNKALFEIGILLLNFCHSSYSCLWN